GSIKSRASVFARDQASNSAWSPSGRMASSGTVIWTCKPSGRGVCGTILPSRTTPQIVADMSNLQAETIRDGSIVLQGDRVDRGSRTGIGSGATNHWDQVSP